LPQCFVDSCILGDEAGMRDHGGRDNQSMKWITCPGQAYRSSHNRIK
jgi:hypothetical protein